MVLFCVMEVYILNHLAQHNYQAPILETQGQALGIQTIPHTPASQQKQQYKSTRRKPMGGNTHTLAYVNKNWQKGHVNKRRKGK
jgi:hypothetical protein